MNKKNIKSVLIIGLGNIGFKYDLNIKNIIISHARAILHHKNFKLIAGVDLHKKNKKLFSKKYNITTYDKIDDFFYQYNADIIIVCTPANTHFTLINRILKLNTKSLIICEKPLASNVLNGKKILHLLNKNNKKIIVNFTRRFNPAVINLKKQINKLIKKNYFKGVVTYSKDLKENGCHFIDLMIYLFGKIKTYQIIDNKASKDNPDFKLYFQNAEIVFIGINSKKYLLNKFSLYCQSYSFYYEDDKDILIFKNKSDKYIKFEKKLQIYKKIKYKKNINLFFLYEYIIKNFNNNKLYNLSNSVTAYETLLTVDKILNKK